MTNERSYKLSVEDRGEYLYALVGGEKLTANIAAAYWNEIAGHCFDLKKDKILIEKDFVEGVGPAEMLEMATLVGDLLPNRKIAFIDRFEHRDINELGKKLARNRLVMMQIFDGIDEAERWLLAN
ncbi:MAG: hypothetical protein ABI539_04495 [Acidobacteriota bacterium]